MSHYDEFEMASRETPTWEFDAQDELRSKLRRRHQSNQPKRYEHDDEFDQEIWDKLWR